MSTDEKEINNPASAEDVSEVQSSETEEIIDLVDEVFSDDDSSAPEQAAEVDLTPQDEEEEPIALTDLVEDSPSEPQADETAVEGEVEEDLLGLDEKQGVEEEEPIELTDELAPEGDSAQDQEGILELTDLVEEPVPGTEESGVTELSEAETGMPEPDDDSLTDTLGLDMSEESPEPLPGEVSEDEGMAAAPEGDEEALLEAVEPQPEAEAPAEPGPEEGVPEPVGGALEQAVLERLSDEKLEEIVTNIARQAIDEKVERILLEAAEAAIGREIERLKQAL